MGTSNAKASSNTNYYERADQVPGFRLKGHNVLEVKAGIKWAKEWSI